MLRRIILATFALAGQASFALAAPPSLTVLGSDECVERDPLVERVEHWLTGPVPESVVVVVELAPPAASLSIRRDDEAPAVRRFPRLEGACDDRIEALALALAIALDPVAVSRRVEAEQVGIEPAVVESDGREDPDGGEPSEPDVDESVGEGEPDSPPESVSDESTSEGRTISFGLALGGGLAWNWLEAPGIAGALALDVGIHPNVTLRAAVVLTGERNTVLGTGRYGGRIVAGELAVRAGRSLGRLRLEGSLGLLAGAMIARGKGFPQNLRTRRPWVALAVGPRLGVSLTERVGAALFVDGVVSALRARVDVIDPNGSSLATTTTPSAGLRVGLEAFALF